MTTVGARLLLPLHRLEDPGIEPPLLRMLHLDQEGGDWATAVRSSGECCLLLDRGSRVSAASPPAMSTLGLAPSALGARFADLIRAVDFTSGGAPDPEQDRALPPLRALATGGLARGLVRVRTADDDLVTYDVVAVPLTRQGGVLAFFVRV
ncbi:MAG: hypothetical protein LC789_13290 [Actinobacteria bacterium]|nr:hypothetical protein [Actinomycetota bacterium]MCA1722043.1 hypothetical protein [Actinomycetota bacterium]